MKVLVVSENEAIRNWLRENVQRHKLPWRLRFTCHLRVCAPENALNEQDLLIVVWDKTAPVTLEQVLKRKAITNRSSESVICEIEANGGEAKLRRTVVLAPHLRREDAVFLSEYEVKVVFALPEEESAWDAEAGKFFSRVIRHHHDEINNIQTPQELAVRRFQDVLGSWDRLSDEKQMESTENLLRALGDSSRYAELIAKKCLKEFDQLGAEQWLKRAITKNPSYLRAVRMLADVYVYAGRYDDAMVLFERLKANNPRNFHRLTKMGHCYLAMGDFHKAEKLLSDALGIDEFYDDAREELGKVKCVLGDFQGAKVLLSQSKNSKGLANFLNQMGIRLVEQRRFEESIEHYKKAQFVLPGNDQGHLLFFNIGLAYAKWGKLSEAARYIRLALARDPCYDKAVTLLKTIETRVSA